LLGELKHTVFYTVSIVCLLFY